MIQDRKIRYFHQNQRFWRKKKHDLISSQRSWDVHFFSQISDFGEKNSKNNSTSPSLKFAKNGRPEPLWSRGFSVQMLCALLLKAFTVVLPSKTCRAYLRVHAATCHYIAFLKGNFKEVVLSYMSSYGSVQSSILRRIWCSTLVEQRMQRPAAKSNENCEGKKCAPQGARSSKKKLYTLYSLVSKESCCCCCCCCNAKENATQRF